MAALIMISLSLSSTVSAGLITATLTGDIRPANPDNLLVNVTVTFDDLNDTTAEWVVDINSDSHHPNIKLDAFYANLASSLDLGNAGLQDDLTFSSFVPTGWIANFNVQPSGAGAGTSTFSFEVDKGTGGGIANVTNTQSLSFTTTLTNGLYWSTSVFTGAPTLNGDAGSGQLGAHLQSLTKGPGNTTDSGFAFGMYQDSTSVPPPGMVPEPGSMVTWSLFAVGCFASARRRRQKQPTRDH
ncbi:hypothetical protein CKO51_23505 [Rhodopirellula sp. SM50]|nr:hypothetical protein [Rhodopirellula sp. SM50]PAY17006.1 hypothetical protein CKO51_23505 [Rhodopirellula sp. SM50]